MGDAVTNFPLIEDWSMPARAALVAENRDVFSALVRLGFDKLQADLPAWLDAARWQTIDAAVDWCLDAFATRDLCADKAAITTWQLFTIPWFWLKQRLGPGYAPKRRLVKAADKPKPLHEQFELSGAERKKPEMDLHQAEDAAIAQIDRNAIEHRLQKTLGKTLARMRGRTCSQLVNWWLQATATLRTSLWFPEETPKPARTYKDASHFRADALARFQVLHHDLLDGKSDLLEAVQCQYFSPCGNEPPFRLPDQEVVKALRLAGVRRLQVLRAEGWSQLLNALIQQLKMSRVGDIERPFLAASLTLTTLDVYGLDEGRDPELRDQILQVPQEPRQGRKAR